MKTRSIFTILGVFLSAVALAAGFYHEAEAGITTALVTQSAGFDRQLYDHILATQGYGEADRNTGSWRVKSGFIITQEYLRSEVILGSDNSYTFQLLDDRLRNNAFNTQKGVEKNDVFIATKYGFFVDAREIATGSAIELQSYPNEFSFNTLAGANIPSLKAVFNGKLKFVSGATEYQKNLETAANLFYPETGKTAATNYDSGSILDKLIPIVAPFVKVSGQADAKMELSVPNFPGFNAGAVTAGWEVRATLLLQGFRVFNGANVVTSVQK
jgi:hypothetical protein